jgi:hypothetical protein
MKTMLDILYPYLTLVLSWPVAMVITACIFRKPITRIVKRIRGFRLGSLELRLSDEIGATSRKIQVLFENKMGETLNNEKTGAAKVYRRKVKLIAKTSPFAVIVYAYSQIENAVQKELGTPKSIPESKDINVVVAGLCKNGKVNEEQYKLFKKMQKIHNAVLSKQLKRIPKKDAVKYGKAAGYLIDLINSFWEP